MRVPLPPIQCLPIEILDMILEFVALEAPNDLLATTLSCRSIYAVIKAREDHFRYLAEHGSLIKVFPKHQRKAYNWYFSNETEAYTVTELPMRERLAVLRRCKYRNSQSLLIAKYLFFTQPRPAPDFGVDEWFKSVYCWRRFGLDWVHGSPEVTQQIYEWLPSAFNPDPRRRGRVLGPRPVAGKMRIDWIYLKDPDMPDLDFLTSSEGLSYIITQIGFCGGDPEAVEWLKARGTEQNTTEQGLEKFLPEMFSS